MMKFGTPEERFAGERRVVLTPESVDRLQKLGYDCLMETGADAGGWRASEVR